MELERARLILKKLQVILYGIRRELSFLIVQVDLPLELERKELKKS